MAESGKDVEVEKPWQKRERILKRDWHRGSKYPPMSIEHMPFERQRLAGVGMTDEDRVLRRQWLLDQELSPNEPRNIPEVKPKNIIKRICAKPWDVFFQAVRPIVGNGGAEVGRFYVPKIMILLTGIWASYYHLKYNSKTWERSGGWDVYGSRETLLWNTKLPPKDDFLDRGFKSRSAFNDLKSSYSQ